MSRQRKKWEMDRRTFLRGTARGAGVFLGLPLLEAMRPLMAQAATSYPDANFVAFFKPLGIAREHFFPKQYQTGLTGTFTGSQWALDGFSTKPLQPHKDGINIFSGAGYFTRGADHEEEACRFLTGLSPLGGYLNAQDVRLDPGSISTQGKSMDQYIAEHLASSGNPYRPAIPSFQLATDLKPGSPNHNNISFKDKNTPLIPTNDIGAFYDALFYGFTTGTSTGSLSVKDQRKRDILADIWNAGTKSLLGKLGASDRNTMESFFQSIADVKKKIDDSTNTDSNSCVKPSKPANSRLYSGVKSVITADLQRHYDIMTDLMIIALQCNRTRVFSYLMEPGRGHGGPRDWSFLIPKIPADWPEQAAIQKMLKMTDYHTISHYNTHSDIGISPDAGLRANALIDQFFVSQLAIFIGKLKAADLFDRTLVLFSSGFGNPSHHSPISVPCITAGRAVGAKTNVHRVLLPFKQYDVNAGPTYYKGAMSRLLVDIMQAFGVPGVTINNFGLREGESLSDPARSAHFGLF